MTAAHPLAQIRTMDEAAERLFRGGQVAKAQKARELAAEWLHDWLDAQLQMGPSLALGDDGEWHCDPMAEDPDR